LIVVNCVNCGSKTPKEIKNLPQDKEIIVIGGYSVMPRRPVFQCKNQSCRCAFNPVDSDIIFLNVKRYV
jgi:hypothetical protein